MGKNLPILLAGVFLRNSLKLWCNFVIIGFDFYWNASRKVSKRVRMPFMKSNGKAGKELSER
jgi:hypothetical protein